MSLENAPRGAHERRALDDRRGPRAVGHEVHFDTPGRVLDAEHPAGEPARFDVAAGRKISRVEALRARRALPFRQEGQSVHFEVPGVVDYEVVALT